MPIRIERPNLQSLVSLTLASGIGAIVLVAADRIASRPPVGAAMASSMSGQAEKPSETRFPSAQPAPEQTPAESSPAVRIVYPGLVPSRDRR